jgi:CubicO group peptidase (beta-lactamase class C family)
MLWYGTSYGRAEVLSRLRHVGQAAGLRSTFSYSNVLYLAAGEALAARAGTSWDDFLSQRVFAPLGMASTRTGVRGLEAVRNVARPHSDRLGDMRPVPFRDGDNVAPAAALLSNAQDMARWMKMLLGRGTLEGRKVLSPEVVEELFSPHMVVPRGAFSRQVRPESHLEAVGLGWFLRDWRGRLLVWNTGGMDGMSCSVGLLPEEGLGVVVLTNGPRTSFPEALVARALEAYTRAPQQDWSHLRLEVSLAYRKRQQEAQAAQEAARQQGTRPTLALERYAGAYAQPLLGELTVAEEKGRLVVRLAGWEGEAEHWHHDTFRVRWSDPELGTSLLTFQLDAEGRPSRLLVEERGEFLRRG